MNHSTEHHSIPIYSRLGQALELQWRTCPLSRAVKYENVYLKGYEDMKQLKAGLKEYFEFYDHQRPHSSLDGSTPSEVYFATEKDKDAA